MKVIECNDYDQNFPESFTWGHIDSVKFSNLANTICNHINHELRKDVNHRFLVPGLRKALNIIAEVADY